MATDQKVGGSSPPGRATPANRRRPGGGSPALVLFALLAAAGPVAADHHDITPDLSPEDVQAVADSAAPGDTVWVAAGTYRRLRVPGGIHLIARAGPSGTVFQDGRGWVIDASDADSTTVIEGITADGLHAAEGGVVLVNSRAVIRDCVITGAWSGVRAIYADVVVENSTVTDCQNGVYLFEPRDSIEDNEIRRCVQGVTLASSSPRVRRNVIRGNSLGLVVAEHSAPSIGGSLRRANRFEDNIGGAVKNTALTRRAGLRTIQPLTLQAPFNFWGTDCPDSLLFRGPVHFTPWVDASGSRSLSSCEDASG